MIMNDARPGDGTKNDLPPAARVGADETLSRDQPSRFGTLRQLPAEQVQSMTRSWTAPPLAEAPPGYTIIEELGRGGMGVVYRARQDKLQRHVALKMILAGSHASRDSLERFRLEAEAIAALQHPLIVQIYDIGEANGLPYLALEYCAGGALDRRLRMLPNNILPPREAAELVQQLSEAVAVAHQKGIIHRDLKPGNVLLSVDGTPKLTDFGLAKRFDTDGAATPEGGLTKADAIMGSPSYMAPEQAHGDMKNVGPAADIYALGAVLYDCLTGRPPFKGASFVETIDLVRHQEPVPPRRLSAGIPVDLETICLKCLRKEPSQRYTTAKALSDDLTRFLAGKPILARPVGPIERARKWAARNPAVASLLASIVLLTGLAMGVITHQWRLALVREHSEREARLETENARKALEISAQEKAELAEQEREAKLKAVASLQKAQIEEARAVAEKARSNKSLEFLSNLFRVSDPFDFGGLALRSTQERGQNLTALELLERGSKQVDEELKDQPLVRATLLGTIGDVYRGMGLYEKAEKQLNISLALRQEILGPHHPETAAALFNLGWLHLDRGDYDLAEKLNRQALAIQEKMLPKDDLATLTTRLHIGWSLGIDGTEEAGPLLKEVVEARSRILGPMHRDTIIAKAGLSCWYFDRQRPLMALPYLADLKAYVKKMGLEDNLKALDYFLEGESALQLKLYPFAEKSFTESLRLGKKQLGEKHLYLAMVLHELGMAQWQRDKLAEAEESFNACLQTLRDTVGLEYPRSRIAITSITMFLVQIGKTKEAYDLVEEAIAVNLKRFGENNRWRFWLHAEHCRLAALLDKFDIAERDSKIILDMLPQSRDSADQCLIFLNQAAIGCDNASAKTYDGRFIRLAEPLYRKGSEISQTYPEASVERIAVIQRNFGSFLSRTGRYQESVEVLSAYVKLAAQSDYIKTPLGIDGYLYLGRSEFMRGRLKEAEEAIDQGYARAKKCKEYTDVKMREWQGYKAACHIENGKLEDAIKVLQDSAMPTPKDGPQTFYDRSLQGLAFAQALAGRPDEATHSLSLLVRMFTRHQIPTVQWRMTRTLSVLNYPLGPIAETRALHALASLSASPGNRYAAIALAAVLMRLIENKTPLLILSRFGFDRPEAVLFLLSQVAEETYADFPSLAFIRAWAYEEAGQPLKARQQFKEASLRLEKSETRENNLSAHSPDWCDRIEARYLQKMLGERFKRP